MTSQNDKIENMVNLKQILDGLGNHDTHPFGDDEVSFDSVDHLRFFYCVTNYMFIFLIQGILAYLWGKV